MRTRALFVVMVLLSALPAAWAADVIDVSPLLNDQTMWVARVNLTKTNLPAAVDWLKKTLSEAKVPAARADVLIKERSREAAEFQQPINALVKAGVKQAIFLLNLPEKPDGTPHLMMAIAQPADPEAVAAVMTPARWTSADITPTDPSQSMTVWVQNIVPGGDNYLSTLTPTARPELLAALAGHDTAAVAGVLAITDAGAAVIHAHPNLFLPPLPQTLSPVNNIKQLKFSLDTAGPHAQIVAETKSAEAVTVFLKHGPKITADIVNALQLSTVGQTVTADIDQAKANRIATAAVPAIELARKQAERVSSMSNMRQILMACMMYANDNKGAVPPALDGSLAQYVGQRNGTIPDALLTNPQHPDLGTNGYIYVPAKEGRLARVKNVSQRLMLYEAGDFGDGVSVGFVDGHVEFINDRARFDALLTAAGRTPTTQPVK